MSRNSRNTNENAEQNFELEYQTIVNDIPPSVPLNLEWSRQGDAFAKFSIYQEYIPVPTSGGTTLLCNI